MIKAIITAFAICVSIPAFAGPYTEAAKKCVADNTSGKDRKVMARWVFLGMSVHPEILSLTSVPDDVREQANRAAGALVTSLIAESCANEFRLAAKNEGGSEAVKAAFELLGVLAMQELMSDPAVSRVFTGLEKYVDNKRIAAVISN
jgi:hypothetical protein